MHGSDLKSSILQEYILFNNKNNNNKIDLKPRLPGDRKTSTFYNHPLCTLLGLFSEEPRKCEFFRYSNCQICSCTEQVQGTSLFYFMYNCLTRFLDPLNL